MTALVREKPMRKYGERQFADQQGYPMKGGVKVLKGAVVVKDATGFATNGSTATGLIVLGIAKQTVDNTLGGNGDAFLPLDVGEYECENSAAADAIGVTEIGFDVFLVDNQTVAKTDGGGTRSRAGKCINVVGGKPVVRLGVGV